MGIVRSKLTRPLKTYNVEHRAHKIISNKEKSKAAPYYPSVHEQIKVAKKVNPNFMEEHNKKDAELYDRLKQVFVTSNILGAPEFKPTDDRPLPKLTRTPDVPEYGYWEPEEVPNGRCHLRDILAFLAKHLTQPEEYTATMIATEYKLDVKDVENILRYYRVLQIIKIEKKENIMATNLDENIKLPKFNEDGTFSWETENPKSEEKKTEEKTIEDNKIDEKNKVTNSIKKDNS